MDEKKKLSGIALKTIKFRVSVFVNGSELTFASVGNGRGNLSYNQFDEITLVGDHTVMLRRGEQVVLAPWQNCAGAEPR